MHTKKTKTNWDKPQSYGATSACNKQHMRQHAATKQRLWRRMKGCGRTESYYAN